MLVQLVHSGQRYLADIKENQSTQLMFNEIIDSLIPDESTLFSKIIILYRGSTVQISDDILVSELFQPSEFTELYVEIQQLSRTKEESIFIVGSSIIFYI
ncbi:hypothetical protein SS50377_27625 [Spironucleus salmonicida]|uniref:Uncharacterized protein n=1 Tax=Spironucleus salmonicida TaxID=348837 RepID=A0A9P8RVY8_9EUKA|nr:hypothetical protein SS50377_27625 [Spironucleus salmonicida]